MCADFVAPQASFSTDVLGAYLRAQSAPIQMQATQQQIAQSQQLVAQSQQQMSQEAQLFPGDVTKQGLGIDQLRLALQFQKFKQNVLQSLPEFGGNGGGAQNQSAPAGGIQTGPQAGVSANAGALPTGSSTPSGSFDGSIDPWSPGNSDSVNSISAPSAQAIGMLAPDMLKGLTEGRDYALKSQQLALTMPNTPQGRSFALLKGIATSANPGQMLIRNTTALQNWPQVAYHFGANPQDLSDINVKRVATMAMNAKLSSVELPTVPIPEYERTVPTGVGGSYQVNDQTNKITEGAPQQETAQFTDKQGNVSMLPKAVGMARGLTPFNAETYVNPGTQGGMAQMIADYKIAPLSGYALRSPQGQAIMAQVMDLNPGYDATKYSAKQEASTAFAGGTLGNTVRSLSVATAHLDTLGKLVGAMDNNDTRAFNVIGNKWQEETGSAAPTNFDTAKHIVGDEVTKAIIGYGGSAGDRENATEVINRANSPAQLKGAIDTYKSLMGGQLGGLKQQYETSTGRKDFESLLSPAAKQQLTTPASGHPAAIQALLDKYK